MNAIKAIVLLMLVPLSVNAMDMPVRASKNDIVYVKTSDNQIIQLAQWMIDEIKVLLVLLEHQHGQNSVSNPILAKMITAEQLQLVSNALTNISFGSFDRFYAELMQQDSQLLSQLIEQKVIRPLEGARVQEKNLILSLEKGKIRTLINAAELLQATGVSAFCLSLTMPPDMAKQLLVPQLIDQVITMCPIKSLPLAGHLGRVATVAFSPDGNKIVSGGDGDQNNLIVWDISNPEAIIHQVLVGHFSNVYTAAFSSDGSKIVSGSYGDQNNLIVWDISNPKSITHQVLVGHPSNVYTAAFSSDGSKIVSGSYGNQNNLIVWDISNPGAIAHQVLAGHPSDVQTVAFSPDGSKIVSGSWGDQNNLIVWNMSDPGAITHQVLVSHPNGVSTVAFSLDGNKIASGGYGNQNNLILWDISNLGAITHQVLVGHPNSVTTVAFSLNGSKIVSGGVGDQNNFIVWDISNPAAIMHQVLVGHPYNVHAVAFSPDGRKIVSGSWGNQNNLIIHQLLSFEQENVLRKCTIAQAQFLYQICLASVRGLRIQLTSSLVISIFNSLSQEVKDILEERFGISQRIQCPPKGPKRPSKGEHKGDCVIF